MTNSTGESEIRDIARKRLQAKQGFWYYIFVWIGVSIIVTVVWFLSSGVGTYFWPGWVIAGMGIAAFFSGLNAYGPMRNVITESKIDAEVRRIRGEGGAPQ